jgi:hypothetical protein
MNTYKISYTIERWYEVKVEADTPEQAEEFFWLDKFDTSTDRLTGQEIQDSITIEEMK